MGYNAKIDVLGGSTENKKSTAKEDKKSTVKEDIKSSPIKLVKVVSEMKCKVCYEKEAKMLFLPCRHNIACEECSKVLKICPVCNAKIEQAILIYR